MLKPKGLLFWIFPWWKVVEFQPWESFESGHFSTKVVRRSVGIVLVANLFIFTDWVVAWHLARVSWGDIRSGAEISTSSRTPGRQREAQTGNMLLCRKHQRQNQIFWKVCALLIFVCIFHFLSNHLVYGGHDLAPIRFSLHENVIPSLQSHFVILAGCLLDKKKKKNRKKKKEKEKKLNKKRTRKKSQSHKNNKSDQQTLHFNIII